ncbi:MAG TPA: asparagine synthase C-terminal domain-containing protein, partial [Anaerolineales bacterium]|nr:asparagine synthase C-terminal domain-containing protein [Anaerolineales bacterium]
NGEIRIERYYELKPEASKPQTEEYYMEGIRHYLREAVRKQMVSDVPLGVYLSGGLDSSSIVALMSQVSNEQIKTFVMGFNEPTDELEDARIVARHFETDHHEICLDAEPLRQYPQVIWHAEEPKENILQGFLLSRFARPFVKVVQGGLGGDELFAGYINNQIIYPSQPFHQITPAWLVNNLLTPISRGFFSIQNSTGRLTWDEYRRAVQVILSIGDPERYYLLLRNVWDYDPGAFVNVYGPAINRDGLGLTHFAFDSFFASRHHGILEQALWTELHTKMVDDFLMNEDRTSMAHGLEVRVPFLDRDLVRFAMGIPVEYKIKNNHTKYIFRKAMTKLLPPQIIQKKKWGFSFNPYYQYQKDLKTIAEQTLTRDRVEARGWFNYAYIRRILDTPPHPRLRWHYYFIWLAVGLEIWAQMFLEGDLSHPEFDLESYMTHAN